MIAEEFRLTLLFHHRMPVSHTKRRIALGALFVALANVNGVPIAHAHNFGLADTRGKILLPPVYAAIRYRNDDCFLVTPNAETTQPDANMSEEKPDSTAAVTSFFVNSRGEKIPTPEGQSLEDDIIALLAPPPMVPRRKEYDKDYPKLKDVHVPGMTMREELGFGYYQFCNDASGGFGVCDETGRIVFQPASDGSGEVRPLARDRFLRSTYTDDGVRLYKLLDQNGKLIAHLPIGIVVYGREFHDGLLTVVGDTTNSTGYINREGLFQIKPGKFTDGKDFNGGVAEVTAIENGVTGGALINTAGKIIAGPFLNGWLSPVADGLAVVNLSQTQCGMLDNSGKFIIPANYEQLRSINEYIVGLKDGQLYVFNKHGKLISTLPKNVTFINCYGTEGWVFGENGKPNVGGQEIDVDPSKKYGVMTPSGKILIPATYDRIGRFENNLAEVGVNKNGVQKQGVIDTDGNFVVPAEYDSVNLTANNIILFNQTKGFDKANWFPDKKGFYNRATAWRNFLELYDVIGMPRSELYRFLGEGDASAETKIERSPESKPQRVTYSMFGGFPMCGNGWQGVELEFDAQDQVCGWRMLSGGNDRGSNADWYRTNVVYIKDEAYSFKVVPKQTAKTYK
jgi:hypothetical protein